jgi:hypothetical protein
MRAPFTESVVEQAALAWVEGVGWPVRYGAEIAPGEPAAEGDDYGQIVLAQRLRDALVQLNPTLPADARSRNSACTSITSRASSRRARSSLRSLRGTTPSGSSSASAIARPLNRAPRPRGGRHEPHGQAGAEKRGP